MSAWPDIRKGWDTARLHLGKAWRWGVRDDPASERKRAEKAARRTQLRQDPIVQAFRWTAIVVGGLVVALLIALATLDWNLLRGPAARFASARLGRQVNIDGDLHVHIWTLTPHVEVDGLRVANADWAGGGDLARIGKLIFDIRLLPLLRGHAVIPLIDVEQSNFNLVRDRDGRNNWTFGSSEASKAPLKLPPIRHFTIVNAQLKITDQRRKLVFTGTINSNESAKGQSRGFWMTGDGTLNREPFKADIRGAPLLNVQADHAYPFTMDLRAGSTHITANGSITHPFDLGQIQARTAFSGNDLNDMYYLTGLTFPNSAPYSMSAKLTRDGEFYRFDDVHGRFNKSDMDGTFTVDDSTDRPYLRAQIHSHYVNFDDLGFMFGGGKGRNTAPRESRTAVTATQKPGISVVQGAPPPTLLLPDAPLEVDRVRQMDAHVVYKADRIDSKDIPVRRLALTATLDHGVLTLDPMEATFVKGRADGSVRLDATRDVPVTSVDMRLRGFSLEQLIPSAKGPAPLQGDLEARAKLVGAGNTVHKAAAAANGTLTFVVPHGQIRAAFAELMGINLLNGGIELLTDDKSPTNLRCMVASFDAHDGVLSTRRMTFDTDVVQAIGTGTVNLKNETVDMSLMGTPKKFRIGRLKAPIEISGSLQAPKVGVDAGKALPQAGIGVALGALVAPLAAILPFVNPGLADDANCGALVAEAKARGAPVKKARHE
jgi:AsmA family protein